MEAVGLACELEADAIYRLPVGVASPSPVDSEVDSPRLVGIGPPGLEFEPEADVIYELPMGVVSPPLLASNEESSRLLGIDGPGLADDSAALAPSDELRLKASAPLDRLEDNIADLNFAERASVKL